MWGILSIGGSQRLARLPQRYSLDHNQLGTIKLSLTALGVGYFLGTHLARHEPA
jgi:hypothetical protein